MRMGCLVVGIDKGLMLKIVLLALDWNAGFFRRFLTRIEIIKNIA